MKTSVERIRGKYHATFSHGNQKFIIHSPLGTKVDAEYQAEMLIKFFKRCPRCGNHEVKEGGGWKFCSCGATW